MERQRQREREKIEPEFKEKVVDINRVTTVAKGGKTFRFSAVVVVGNEKGTIGIGSGKASEVPEAIRKAIQRAKNNLIEVPIVGTTVPHEYLGVYGGAKVLVKPSIEGAGIIAGGAARAVLELAGYKDAGAKVLGSNNPRNIVKATVEALKHMRTEKDVSRKRGIKIENI